MLLPCLAYAFQRVREKRHFERVFMTDIEKADTKIVIVYGLAVIAIFFYVGFMDSLDKAMDRQLAENRLSVYCQQAGAIETLCAGLRVGSHD